MRKITSIIILLLSIPFFGLSQRNIIIDTTRAQLINTAEEIINAANTCALITIDEQGRARVRAMDPFAPTHDFVIWFGTNKKSRKVNQIINNPRVTLYYLDKDASGYVMIHGLAHLVDDPEEKENHWKEEWNAFYSKKRENYLLIKVIPTWLEVSSAPRGIVGDTITWEPPKILFESK